VLIEHILHRKGHEVATIRADARVADAVASLREHNVGALVVTTGSSAPAGDDGAAGSDTGTSREGADAGEIAGGAGAEEDADGGERTAAGAAGISGILSERDIVRALAAGPDAATVLDRPVSALMSTELTTCGPQATVDELMRMMTDRRIRHIPVLDGGRLTGIVSIGDVVKTRIDELQTETDTLHEYLSSGR
jgi:CBS domain-containing protein